MSRIRYGVAMSLDGFIAGPNGEADWIVIDPELNFAELWAQFDTLLMGRRTYQAALARLGKSAFDTMNTFVASRTLQPSDHAGVTILSELNPERLQSLRTQSKKDIWLMGGGALFAQLLAIGEVDTVEVTVIPVLLGGGVALLPNPAERTQLRLLQHRIYPSGTVHLVYEIQR
jgi:dihydrofolate reductase